jgi:phage terminase large subunit GpA-like protein
MPCLRRPLRTSLDNLRAFPGVSQMNLQESQTLESFESGYSRSAGPSGLSLLSHPQRQRYRKRAATIWREIMTPPRARSPIEWAEENYQIPKGSAEPGPFRSARTPYLAPMLASLAKYKKLVVITGSQMAKTTGFLIVIGQKLDDDPAPVLYVGPTKSNVDSAIEPRVAAMLRSSASLWSKTDRSRSAKKLVKRVAGVTLSLAWAGSPTELASRPAHTVLIDELDRMEPIPGEGDVVTLAEARMATYPDGRLLVTSTPLEGNVGVEKDEKTGIEHFKVADVKDLLSPIWKLWQEGTRFEWAVPCPECKQYFVPRFSLLWWPDKCGAQRAKTEARLICQRCGVHIEDSDKTEMNAMGQFLAPGQDVVDGVVVGEIPETDTASFWASGLMSPWRTFGSCAARHIRATGSGDQETIRGVINTVFGELYAFKGEATPPEAIRACVGHYVSGDVPDGVKAITCAVDVQKRKLVYAVRGWGFSMESWGIEAGELWGETENRQVWAELGALLDRDFGGRQIRRMGIDSGYRPGDKYRRPDNLIYEFCMQYRGRVVPTKGRDSMIKPLQPSLIDVTYRGQTLKQGLQLWHLDTDYFKSWLVSRFTWPSDQPGRFWVPEDVTDDYCLQMTAETRVAKPSGRAVWVRVRPDNHYFDCETINVAMAQSLGFHRFRPKKAAAEKTAAAENRTEAGQPATTAATPAPAPNIARRRQMMPAKNWTTGWK